MAHPRSTEDINDPVPENLLPVIKMSYNFLSKFNPPSFYEDFRTLSTPQHAIASFSAYKEEVNTLIDLGKLNKDKRYLSIQFFASHGFVRKGNMAIAVNIYD